jgi:serralysin
VANSDRWCFTWAADRAASLGANKAALLEETMWTPGDTITVSFLDGDPGVQQKVQDYAEKWTVDGLANLMFEFRRDTSSTSSAMPSG